MQKLLKRFLTLILFCLAVESCKESDPNDPCSITLRFNVNLDPNDNLEYQAVVSGGLPPYMFKWSGGEPHPNNKPEWRIPRFRDENISLTVTDALGCEATITDLRSSDCSRGTITDVDGNTYQVVSIGNKCWLASNLMVSAGIPQVTDSAVWVNTTAPAWCYYNNDPANATYGKIYNWYAVQKGMLCPTGWRIPTKSDWQELEQYLGNEPAGKLKSTTGWDSPNTGATNSTKFSAIPAGYRVWLSNHFIGLGQTAGFWSSTQASDTTAFSFVLTYDSHWPTNLPVKKRQGYSCRCIEN